MSDNDYDLDFLEFELSEKYKGDRIKAAREDFYKEAKEQASYMLDCLSTVEIVDYAKEIESSNDEFSLKTQSMLKEFDKKGKLSEKQLRFLCLHYQLNKSLKKNAST